MKLFGGPGELEASLGEPGVRKSVKMTILPSILSIFRIFFPKHRKTFRIARQLVSSSSIRLARIKMLANEGP